MSTPQFCPLPSRGVIRVTGSDAAPLLEGLLTNSLIRLGQQGAIHTGLLSPQGKILFDFFLVATADEFLIDIDAAMADNLIKRLSFYRLRADVQFDNISDEHGVAALWPAQLTTPGGIISYPDPRQPALGLRLIMPRARFGEIAADHVDEDAYHAHRIASGVPDAGLDYTLPDTFPHEALYDQMNSIDFKKGCFIGQEVVSRMQHRGTARKRAMRVEAAEPITSGAPIEAGTATIGTIGSTSGNAAIAILRLDRAAEAETNGVPLTAGLVPIKLSPPEWITFDVASGKPATSH